MDQPKTATAIRAHIAAKLDETRAQMRADLPVINRPTVSIDTLLKRNGLNRKSRRRFMALMRKKGKKKSS